MLKGITGSNAPAIAWTCARRLCCRPAARPLHREMTGVPSATAVVAEVPLDHTPRDTRDPQPGQADRRRDRRLWGSSEQDVRVAEARPPGRLHR